MKDKVVRHCEEHLGNFDILISPLWDVAISLDESPGLFERVVCEVGNLKKVEFRILNVE